MTTLVERLNSNRNRPGVICDPDKIAAADEIERLQAENAALRHDIERHVAIAAGLATENESLRAANEKLEADARRLDWLDAQCSQGGRHIACLPGHLRAAIDAALAADRG